MGATADSLYMLSLERAKTEIYLDLEHGCPNRTTGLAVSLLIGRANQIDIGTGDGNRTQVTSLQVR